ncbi:hypothetical protein ACEPAG_8740 [Sanghuangporus baumii]
MVKNDDKYTDPGEFFPFPSRSHCALHSDIELRSQIKEDVQAGDKGSQPGQWSARKAQMMASEYKKQMHERREEPYTTDKSEQSEGQKHLNDWTKEEWQTSEGKGNAKQADGTEQRYLPKKAWESMTEEEKEATNKAKLEGSARGEQYVSNTSEAQKARKDAKDDGATAIDGEDADGDVHEQTDGEHETEENVSPKRGSKHKRDEKDDTDEGDADEETTANEKGEEEAAQSQPPAKQAKGDDGEKRTTQSKSKDEDEDESAKADEETDGKKGDEEHGEPASATRLPKEGQHVFWRATPGWVEGTVVEICHSEKEVDGKHVKASQDDPRIVLKSAKSGKTAVHKPEAVYF